MCWAQPDLLQIVAATSFGPKHPLLVKPPAVRHPNTHIGCVCPVCRGYACPGIPQLSKPNPPAPGHRATEGPRPVPPAPQTLFRCQHSVFPNKYRLRNRAHTPGQPQNQLKCELGRLTRILPVAPAPSRSPTGRRRPRI